MRALWKGSINFGLINIPVKMFGASEERAGIELDLLHRSDLTPVKYVRVCTQDGKEVPLTDLVKGYEYREGAYVTLEEEDFERANLRATKTVDIHEFTDPASINPMYYDKPYFLVPDASGEQAYALLHEALRRTGKAGVATFVLRGRGRLGVLTAQGPVIVLQRLRFASEVRDPATVDVPRTALAQKELDVAVSLVEFLTQPFRIGEYRDTYTEELQRMIDEKVRGQGTRQETAAVVESAPTKPEDLMKLLRASLDREKGRFTTRQSGKREKRQAERSAVRR